MAKFIHLRLHTSYSLAESAVKIEDIAPLCKKHNMPAIAVTDSGNLFCSLEFSYACSKKGIKPIIGSTLNIFREEKDRNKIYDKIVLLAKNENGYKNLLKLVSKTFLEKKDNEINHITLADLFAHSEGLIVLTASHEGTLGKLILEGSKDEAKRYLTQMRENFGEHLYIELVRQEIKEQQEIEPQLIDLAFEFNLPLVATNPVQFVDSSMHEAHDALLCIAGGNYVAEENRRKSNKNSYFKSPLEMEQLFADVPEAIENTILIAKKCSFYVKERQAILPRISENENEELKRQAKEGLEERLKSVEGNKEVYYSRLEYELSVILSMNFAGYFLIVSDFIKWSKKNSVPVGPGRGSGAGSIIAWSLQITDLDPIKFGLLFERFLNPERISMPDFDIDFCQERRDEVIKYVQAKYGFNRVAQIITFGKLQARAVVRDVGRVLQMPYSQVDRISKLVPFNAVNPVTLAQAIEMEPAFEEAKLEDEQVAEMLDISLKLEGLHRHASTHAAGIIIADRDLMELVPLYQDDKSDMLVIQYSMKYAEMAGLVKFDFLGLKTLTLIDKACRYLRERGVIDIDISNIPFDDKKTFEMLSRGDASGVFQFESAGMRDSLRKMKPDAIEDLMALGALYRPGPMDNIPTYIACKHGVQKPDYLHPKLEGILKETFGVIIYQEQVLQIAQVLAGYSLGAADLLRRAMGKKIKEEMDAQRELFVNGAIKNNIDKNDASRIFDLVAKFAGYGFNRAHAAAYGVISYQTAYLKANYPLEFMTAQLNIERHDTDKINLYIQEAKAMGLEILPPDINKSSSLFTIEDNKIRYALSALKNVGEAAMDEVVVTREREGNFENIFDFAEKVSNKVLNKRQLENLIKAGSFDNLESNRNKICSNIDKIISYSTIKKEEKESKQISLFAAMQDRKLEHPVLPVTYDWSDSEKLNNEFEAFGFYMSKHPLEKYGDIIKRLNLRNSDYLNNELPNGFYAISMAAIAISTKTRMSPKGRYVSMLASDQFGTIEVAVFDNDLLARARELINSTLPLILTLDARKDDGGVRLTARDIKNLNDAIKFSSMTVWLNSAQQIGEIKNLYQQIPKGGRVKATLNILQEGQYVTIELPDKLSLSFQDIENFEKIESVEKVEVV